MENTGEFFRIFSPELRRVLERMPVDFHDLQEVRLRAGCPLLVTQNGEECFVREDGQLLRERAGGVFVNRRALSQTMEYIADYSLYAFEEELRQGFLTIPGGHRVGVAGKIILEGGKVKGIRYISFLNIRLSHQKKGCADRVLPHLLFNGRMCHTLIISPPGCGKTTLLRDMIRQISDGTESFPGCTVGVVDERSEIGGAYLGVPQNDLGIRTDVLDCCPKAEGMMMLVRAMTPKVIAVDEIGDARDVRAMETVVHCGCRLLATVHGASVADVQKKPLLRTLMRARLFERYVVLKSPGALEGIYDERQTRLCPGKSLC